MLPSVIMLMSLVGFFGGNSVSTVEGTEALLVNPAGVAINRGVDLLYSRSEWNSQVDLMVLRLYLTGLGVKIDDGNLSYITGSGIKLGNTYLGYSYSFGSEDWLNIGIITRPYRFLSLGLNLHNNIGNNSIEESYLRGGIGIRPFTDRITLFFDALYRDSIRDYTYGVGIEPVSGIIASFTGDKDKTYRFGIELSLGNLKTGYDRAKEEGERKVSSLISLKPYPSFIPPRKKVLDITLSGEYSEERTGGFFTVKKNSFYDLIKEIETAGDDKSVVGLALRVKRPKMSLAQVEELRHTVERFNREGKKTIIFAEGYSMKYYYLATACHKIFTIPTSAISLRGIYTELKYIKGTLNKLNIEPDLVHIGKYKSAVEPLEREDMSEADREQREELLRDIYNEMTIAMAESKGIDKEEIDRIINEEVFLNAPRALSLGLVDSLIYEDELLEFIDNTFGKGTKRISHYKRFEETEVRRAWRDDKPEIALIVAEGSIVSGKSGESRSPIPLLGGKYIGSETLASQLRKVREDNSVKAVVLRVNSPGGSGLASDVILRELKKTREKKPVIVSMGSVAASGGYYISSSATKILADRTTVTGSIGVISGKLVTDGFYRKLGITSDYVKIGEHADAFSSRRKFTPEERYKLEEDVRWFYNNFVGLVAESRGLSPQYVDSIGQGRVWSGEDAEGVGLVDEIGGIWDAIQLAKEEAGIEGDIKIQYIMRPLPLIPFFGGGLFSLAKLYMFDEPYLYLTDGEWEIK